MTTNVWLSGAVALLAALSVGAQTERSGNADARVLQQLQVLTSERAALQAENATLQKELGELKNKLAGASSAKSALENRARTLEAAATRDQASGEQAQAQLARARDQLQELIAQFRQTGETLREVETDRATIKRELGAKAHEFNTCVDRNVALYTLNTDVLNWMENRGLWSSLVEREPFTRLKRVELENLIDDYRYRAEEQALGAQAR